MQERLAITADKSRILKTEALTENSEVSIDVPRDTVFKHLLISTNGSVVTTFASGTPVADDTAFMDRVINSINVISNGSFNIKNVTPWMMHVQQLMATGNFGVRRASAGASASSYPTADAGFPFGTTTQLTSVNEAIMISFENVMAGKGRMKTLWDTRGLASAELKFSIGSFSNILAHGNTAPVVFSSNLFQIQVETIETQNVPLNIYYSAFKQTTKRVNFTAQVSDSLVEVNRGNFLQGFLFQVRDGAAGSATTNTGKQLSNTLLEKIQLIINGSTYPQNTTFKSLQAKNIERYGLNVPFSSNKSLLDGICYMDLLTPLGGEKFGALETAQNVQAPLVDEVQLSLSTSAAGPYTDTAAVTIMTNEIVPPVVQK